MISKSILLILAESDFNEAEYLKIKYVLEKSGFKLFIASDSNSLCTGNKGLKVRPDIKFFNMNPANFSGLMIVGGNGIRNYEHNELLLRLVAKFNQSKKLIGAICAAPIILAASGILSNRSATCHPSDKGTLEKVGVIYTDVPYIADGNIITARDQNTARDFAETFASSINAIS